MKPDELYLLHVYRAARPEYQLAVLDILEAHPAADKLPAEPHDGQITILAEYRSRREEERMIYIYAIAEELREQNIQPDDIDAIMAAAQLDYAQAELVSDELQALHAYDSDGEEEEAEDGEEDDEDT